MEIFIVVLLVFIFLTLTRINSGVRAVNENVVNLNDNVLDIYEKTQDHWTKMEKLVPEETPDISYHDTVEQWLEEEEKPKEQKKKENFINDFLIVMCVAGLLGVVLVILQAMGILS